MFNFLRSLNPFKFTTDKALVSISKLLEKLDTAVVYHHDKELKHSYKMTAHALEADRAKRVADKFRDLVS